MKRYMSEKWEEMERWWNGGGEETEGEKEDRLGGGGW